MKDDLHLYLNGERPEGALDEGSRQEAEPWGRLLEAFRTEMAPVPPPPWLEERVMAEIEALPERGLARRLGRWLLAPRPVRVSPLLAGATAVAALLLLVFGRPSPPGAVEGPDEDVVLYVQFTLEAPGAQSVAVAGDFDAWVGSYPLEDSNGDGVWTGRVPLHPGVHAYMFLVDGTTWVTDPRAERYTEDGFGNRNAVLALAVPSV